MRGFSASGAALAAILALGAGPAAAQEPGIDPDEPCGQALRRAGDTEKLMVAAWLHGYRSATGEASGPVDLATASGLLNDLFTACLKDESQSLNQIMSPPQSAQVATEPQSGGSQADAERLLQRFLDPAADRVALTAQLKPSPQDIADVYAEPLASKLVASYAQTFTPGIRIGPKPDQDALLVYYATTGQLKSGDPVLSKFPGGYGDVLQYFRGDHPIVRFKFVAAGEELGLAFDGLIFVNGRWVLMPKPWRALE